MFTFNPRNKVKSIYRMSRIHFTADGSTGLPCRLTELSWSNVTYITTSHGTR